MQHFQKNDTVRTLVPVQLPGWKTQCGPGFHFTVEQVNDDGTLLLARSGPDGKVSVKTSEVEHAYKICNGTSYSSRTTKSVVHVLEAVRKSRCRIRVRLGDTETGRDWLEEHDVAGTIGNSMGPTKIPLIIHSRRSHGGPGLLDDAIVKITTTVKGRTLYHHPNYHTGEMKLVAGTNGYAAAVNVDGKLHAQFKSEKQALRWMKRMA